MNRMNQTRDTPIETNNFMWHKIWRFQYFQCQIPHMSQLDPLLTLSKAIHCCALRISVRMCDLYVEICIVNWFISVLVYDSVGQCMLTRYNVSSVYVWVSRSLCPCVCICVNERYYLTIVLYACKFQINQ